MRSVGVPLQRLSHAAAIRRATGVPVIAVGGIRSGAGIAQCFAAGVDAISMCRPLICEPDFPQRLRSDPNAVSLCTHCNLCTVHCDGDRSLRCYRRKESA